MEENIRFAFISFFVIAVFCWASFFVGELVGQQSQTRTICDAECGPHWALEESRCVCLVPIEPDRLEFGYSK